MGQRDRQSGSFAPVSSAVSRPVTRSGSSLGQEEGDVSAASVTRDVGLHIPSEEWSERTRESWTVEELRGGERLTVSFGVAGGKECGRLNKCGPHSAIGGGINRQGYR